MGTVKRIKFDTWPELLEAVKFYDDLGLRTEIQGFDDLSQNILTVYGYVEVKNEKSKSI